MFPTLQSGVVRIQSDIRLLLLLHVLLLSPIYPTDSAPESLQDEPPIYPTDSAPVSLQGELPIYPPDSAPESLQDEPPSRKKKSLN